jgi:YggT family protein
MTTLVTAVSWLFRAYEFLILIRVLLSWINVNPYRPAIDHPLIRLLQRVTDPVLVPLRRVIPPLGGGLDISPVVALFLLEILRSILTGLLLRL